MVEELPAYEPEGVGEHLFVRFRKTGWTTEAAVRAIAGELGVDPRGAGYAGMKDRHAVTTQTASFPVPMAVADASTRALGIALSGIEVLEARRHVNKLKPGHLLGNRFTIVLRDLGAEGSLAVRARLEETARTGVPNAFGPQRFGRDGDNPERALAWLAGRERGPRDRHQQRLLFSALQALLFNQVLTRREADGSWSTVLPGDLAKKHDTGGLFPVPLEGAELDDARERAMAGLVSATGPMFGAKMRWPAGAPLDLEREILAATIGEPSRLDAARSAGEGTRRSLRMMVSNLTSEPLDGGGGLSVSFVLPKGGYATTVLGRACRILDATRAVTEASAAALGTGEPEETPAPSAETSRLTAPSD